MFVGVMFSGIILVISDNQIINQFNACNGNSVILTSFLFDNFDNMGTLCATNQLFYFYFKNVTFRNKNITTLNSPRFVGFD